jgi:predicted HD superfamily hydrolase involved in NAD metabolism
MDGDGRYSIEELEAWLRGRVSERRFLHSLGVRESVADLARIHGVETEPLAQAALLHDCAREMSGAEMLARSQEWGIPVRDVDRRSPVLLHGRLAVAIADRELGIDEPRIVSAVLHHTAGHPQMSLSDKLFFLSDHIEPTRRFAWVDELKAAAGEDVDRAMLMAVDINIRHLLATGRTIDPWTLELRRSLTGGDA